MTDPTPTRAEVEAWNAALEAAETELWADSLSGDISDGALQWCLDTIRALRRAAPTEGEA